MPALPLLKVRKNFSWQKVFFSAFEQWLINNAMVSPKSRCVGR
jgi:hypothetical protein